MKKINLIRQGKLKDLRVFFNTLDYRTPHFHKNMEIMWNMNEKLYIRSENKTYTIDKGEIIFLNMNQPHECKKIEDRCTVLTFQILPEMVIQEVPDIQYIFFNETGINDLQEEAGRELRHLLFQIAYAYFSETSYFELYCKSKMQECLYLLLSHSVYHTISTEERQIKKQQNLRLERLLQFVDNNYKKKIRLSDFAESEGLSLSSVSHLMKKETGMGFQDYVNYIRFNEASRLLANTDYKMIDVCMESGFSDYRYFSNTFLKYTGVTPREYSLKVRKILGDETKMYHHSIHSKEQFYTQEQSLELLDKYKKIILR